MMTKRMTGVLGGVLAAALVLSPRPAEATQVRLGLGANYWFDQGALFDLNVSVLGRVTRRVHVGGRVGAFLATDPDTLGMPLDILIRGTISNVYLEAMAGPWIRFEDDPLLGHFAFGFGLQGEGIAVGIEFGYLDPDPIAGLKLSFTF